MPPRKQQEVVVAISDDENDDALTRKTKRDRGIDLCNNPSPTTCYLPHNPNKQLINQHCRQSNSTTR